MQEREVSFRRSDGDSLYRATLRLCTLADRRVLASDWVTALRLGSDPAAARPAPWLDCDWNWAALDKESELAFPFNTEFVVIVDDVEDGADKKPLGVLVTSYVSSPRLAALDLSVVGGGALLWVEYIAIAPAIRPNCRVENRRSNPPKSVGSELMCEAIRRSFRLGAEGRVGLHAEGSSACDAYSAWQMKQLPDAPHPAGGAFPVFFGDQKWAGAFVEKVERSKR